MSTAPKTTRSSGQRPSSLRSDSRQKQEGLWKLTSRRKSAKNADFHRDLKKPRNDARLFHSSHSPTITIKLKTEPDKTVRRIILID